MKLTTALSSYLLTAIVAPDADAFVFVPRSVVFGPATTPLRAFTNDVGAADVLLAIEDAAKVPSLKDYLASDEVKQWSAGARKFNVDLPKVDLPKVDLPKVDLPKVDLPKVDIPGVDLPKVNMPKVDLPKVDLPSVSIPDLPKVDLPKVGLPSDLSVPAMDLNMDSVAFRDFLKMFDVGAVLTLIHWDEYQLLYVAAAGLLFGVQQRNAGRYEASQKSEKELRTARDKATEAATLAAEAADRASRAKELAVKVDEGVTETKALESENEQATRKLRRVMEVTARLEAELNAVKEAAGAEKFKQQNEKKAAEKAEVIRQAKEAKQIEEAKRLAATLAEETAAKEAVTEAAEIAREKAASEMKALEVENEKVSRKLRRVMEVTARLEAELNAVKEAAGEEMFRQKKEKTAAERAEKIRQEREAAKEAKRVKDAELLATKLAEESAAREAAIKAAKIAKEEAAAAAAAAAAAVEKPVVVEAVPATSAPVATGPTTDKHPWAKLSPSTLGKKTVAQLTEFLTEKNVPVVDETGKKLLKKDLLAATKECLQ